MHQNWPSWPSLRTHPAPRPRPSRPCLSRTVRPAACPCAPTPCLPASLRPVACAPRARQPNAPAPACEPSTPLRARLLPSPCCIVAWLATVLQYSPALPLLHSCNAIFCITIQIPLFPAFLAIQSHNTLLTRLQYNIFLQYTWAVAQNSIFLHKFFFFIIIN